MPELKKTKQDALYKKQKKAYKLHQRGFTYREIGDKLGYSHQWAMTSVATVEDKEGSPCCGAPVSEDGRCSKCKEGTR